MHVYYLFCFVFEGIVRKPPKKTNVWLNLLYCISYGVRLFPVLIATASLSSLGFNHNCLWVNTRCLRNKNWQTWTGHAENIKVIDLTLRATPKTFSTCCMLPIRRMICKSLIMAVIKVFQWGRTEVCPKVGKHSTKKQIFSEEADSKVELPTWYVSKSEKKQIFPKTATNFWHQGWRWYRGGLVPALPAHMPSVLRQDTEPHTAPGGHKLSLSVCECVCAFTHWDSKGLCKNSPFAIYATKIQISVVFDVFSVTCHTVDQQLDCIFLVS